MKFTDQNGEMLDDQGTESKSEQSRFYIHTTEVPLAYEIIDRESGDSVCEILQSPDCHARYICDALNEKHCPSTATELRNRLRSMRRTIVKMAERYGVLLDATIAFLDDDIRWPLADGVALKMLPHLRALREAVELPNKSRVES